MKGSMPAAQLRSNLGGPAGQPKGVRATTTLTPRHPCALPPDMIVAASLPAAPLPAGHDSRIFRAILLPPVGEFLGEICPIKVPKWVGGRPAECGDDPRGD